MEPAPPFLPPPLFEDRRDAGRHLARSLAGYRETDSLVLGIPRGGVVVAAEVARELGAELDVVVARKLGAPLEEELAIGAVTADGERWLNQGLVQALDLSPNYLDAVTTRERAEAARRERRFRGDRPPPALGGRPVIVVDDGLATGATTRVALRSVRRRGPGRLILAVPVGAAESCRALEPEVDQVVCPFPKTDLVAISLYYRTFPQVEDAEVEALLAGSGLPSHCLVEHTGELVLQVRGRSWGEVLAEAGRALGALELGETRGEPSQEWRRLEVSAADREALLVEWLNELLFQAESERWIATDFQVESANPTRAVLRGRGVRVQEAPGLVKAATYHRLRVQETGGTLTAEVLLDV